MTEIQQSFYGEKGQNTGQERKCRPDNYSDLSSSDLFKGGYCE